MVELDKYEQNILSIEENTEVEMSVHGKTQTYKPIQNNDGSWEMNVVNSNNIVYGLSCINLKELRALLLADYGTGIITNVIIANS